MSDTLNHKVAEALSGLAAEAPLRVGAAALLGALGYESRRSLDVGSVQEFLERLNSAKQLTEKQHALFEPWRAVEVVFQFTGKEISGQPSLFDGVDGFDQGRIESFLFLAVELSEERYGRTQLAEMTRVANRLFKMPVIIFFRHGTTLTLAAVHRRAHKRDGGRDVLERVTLVKDIRVDRPHRAHVEILGDLALPRLMTEGVRDFDDLHVAWERVLDIEALNRRFYKELFGWFERAVEACRFPDDGAGEGGTERHVIRLITRLLFIWFLKEKGLVPDELFEESFACTVLNEHAPDGTDYYRAVLQNLFFATLNTEVDRRAFSKKANATHRDFTKYRYRSLLGDPEGFTRNLEQVPFVNGGLFDCLDDFAGAGAGGRRIDAFTDNAAQGRDLNVPAHLFFDPKDGLFPLFRHYKFTVEENTPLDREVALDPELLGRVFENLLASYNPETRETARKASGSYYTPRQVVDYMVQEVLTEALAARTEPADGDIAWWRERLSYLLDHSDAMDDADEFFDESDKRTVVAAIANIGALDPAVGSGAFPMGILQTLTLALRRLDPRNALWEEFQKERAKARAGEAFDTRDQQQRDDALREISHTFEKYRQSDFGRKLYLIQNSIYGVDIQPIACQIAKLRFFISLVIEQDPDPGAPNLGIKPLPNLETRFVAADTLIGLQAETVALLLDDGVLSKRKEVEAVRERYFLADSRPTKLDCISEEQRLRGELQELLENERRTWIAAQRRDIEDTAKSLPNPAAQETYRESELRKLALRQRSYDAALADARKVAEWDPYDQNARAGWFEPEYMFGVQGGFDVVVGNPPYIQLQKDGGLLGKRYQGVGYETFARTGDIYQLFYERGCGVLRPGAGTLAYITSNSWLKAEYGKRLRRWLAERHTPLSLIEMGKDVFDAIVDTGVLAVREGGSADRLPAVDMDRLADGEFPPPDRKWREARPSGEAPWRILSSIEWQILDKINSIGIPLKDWNVRINRGVTTGYNAAFVIDDTTRNTLIAEDFRSEEVIKPMLRGRDIRRWRAQWARKWLISTFPSLQLDINHYPAVKRHLLGFGQQRLEQSGELLSGNIRARKKTNHAWFEIQDSVAYHQQFSKEKIVWIELVERGRFAYDEEGLFGEDTTFVLSGKYLKFLCGVLNTKLIQWFLGNAAPTSGMGTLRWKKVYVEIVPIPRIPPKEQRPIIDLVDLIIATKKDDLDADVSEEEEAIDRLVYALYGLDKREITMVERAAPS